jgi:hypothetical protein
MENDPKDDENFYMLLLWIVLIIAIILGAIINSHVSNNNPFTNCMMVKNSLYFYITGEQNLTAFLC